MSDGAVWSRVSQTSLRASIAGQTGSQPTLACSPQGVVLVRQELLESCRLRGLPASLCVALREEVFGLLAPGCRCECLLRELLVHGRKAGV